MTNEERIVTRYKARITNPQDVSTAALKYEVSVGRQISRAEALRITRQVLERAERERTELAEWEGKHGMEIAKGLCRESGR